MAGYRISVCYRWFFPPFATLFVALAVTVTAQERKPFFERDFAKNPLEEQATPRPERTGPPADEDGTEVAGAEPPATDAALQVKERLEALAEGKEATQPTDITALTKTHKVLSVGGVINALDKDHFQEKMKELLEVVDRYDFDVGFIWAIGSVQNLVNSPEAIFLVARQAMIEAAEAPPEHYKITMSPTWVIRTPEGEILLEATGPLAANFNTKGEFIERPNEMRVERKDAPARVDTEEGDAAPPTPTVVPSPTPDPLFGGVQPKL